MKTKHRWKPNTNENQTPMKTKHQWKPNINQNQTPIKTKHQWKPNTDKNQTLMKTKHRWKPNTNENQTAMKTKHQWKRNTNENQTPMKTKHKWKPNTNENQTPMKTKHQLKPNTNENQTPMISWASTAAEGRGMPHRRCYPLCKHPLLLYFARIYFILLRTWHRYNVIIIKTIHIENNVQELRNGFKGAVPQTVSSCYRLFMHSGCAVKFHNKMRTEKCSYTL